MISIKKFDTSTNVYPADNFSAAGKKYFIVLCAFWLFIALLEFGQDYISAMLNDHTFVMADSLSYKLFWPLFIPLSLLLDYGIRKTEKAFSGATYLIRCTILVILITGFHLILFSLFLFGLSNLIDEKPVTLLYLLYEKLSTRLYIALAIYFVLAALYHIVRRRRSHQKMEQKVAPKSLKIKNGMSITIVDVADIKWIGSDGGYLDIYTLERRFVVLDTLKNMMVQLPGNFKRIHRSTIVNMDRIVELKSRGNGDYDVVMDDDQVLRLSRNYTEQLRGILL